MDGLYELGASHHLSRGPAIELRIENHLDSNRDVRHPRRVSCACHVPLGQCGSPSCRVALEYGKASSYAAPSSLAGVNVARSTVERPSASYPGVRRYSSLRQTGVCSFISSLSLHLLYRVWAAYARQNLIIFELELAALSFFAVILASLRHAGATSQLAVSVRPPEWTFVASPHRQIPVEWSVDPLTLDLTPSFFT